MYNAAHKVKTFLTLHQFAAAWLIGITFLLVPTATASDGETAVGAQTSSANRHLLEAHDHISRELKFFHSFMVVYRDQVLCERYYSGLNSNSLNNIKSCTKTVTSILVGIALKEGRIRSTDQKASFFFPEYSQSDTDKNNITIKHLLSMTTGLAWVDNDAQMDRWWNGENLFKSAWELPMAQKPGAAFNYCSPASHLLSAIITKSSELDTFDFARKNLFAPLGIKTVNWSRDRMGICYGFGEMFMTTRDMARIGGLYLKNGRWNGQQIVTPAWVSQSTQVQIKTGNPIGDYGYGWWIKQFGPHKCHFAAGWGGQHIFVIPDLELVVVTTQDCQLRDPVQQHGAPFMLMEKYVIPAVTNSHAPNAP